MKTFERPNVAISAARNHHNNTTTSMSLKTLHQHDTCLLLLWYIGEEVEGARAWLNRRTPVDWRMAGGSTWTDWSREQEVDEERWGPPHPSPRNGQVGAPDFKTWWCGRMEMKRENEALGRQGQVEILTEGQERCRNVYLSWKYLLTVLFLF